MNTIALRGRRESGKSTTIRLMYPMFQSNGYNIDFTNFDPNGGDYFAIFTKNGKKVGVTSRGDTYDAVADDLQDMVNSGCDICVCACRTYDRISPGTNAAVNELPGYTSQFIEKTVQPNASLQPAANNNDANVLFSTIDRLV